MKTKAIKTFLPWLMWLLAALFYSYEFLLQVSPGVMVKELMHAFSVRATALGFLASIYYYAYAAMQVPAGILLDRYGVHRLLTFAAAICALGCILFASTHLFIIAAFARLCIGFGSAFALISCMYIAATCLPNKIFSLLTGILLSIGMIGAVCGQAPLALLVAKLTWQVTILMFGIAGIIIAILVWLIIRDHKIKDHPDFYGSERKLLQGLKLLVRNPQNWIVAIQAGLMFTPTIVIGSIWGTPFISSKYHLTTAHAAALISMLFIGWAIGAPAFGWLSDYFCKRKFFLIIGSIGTLISLILFIYYPAMPLLLLGVTSFTTGAFSSSLIIAFSVAKEINSATATGAAIGFMNCINMVGGIVVPPLVGLVLDIGAKFELALTILPTIILIALIMLIAIREPCLSN